MYHNMKNILKYITLMSSLGISSYTSADTGGMGPYMSPGDYERSRGKQEGYELGQRDGFEKGYEKGDKKEFLEGGLIGIASGVSATLAVCYLVSQIKKKSRN